MVGGEDNGGSSSWTWSYSCSGERDWSSKGYDNLMSSVSAAAATLDTVALCQIDIVDASGPMDLAGDGADES